MLHPKTIRRQTFTVGAYDIDSRQYLTIPNLMRMIHEVAMQNAIDLGLSYWDLIPHQVSWVIIRKRLEVMRIPKLGETFTVETHPSGFDKLFAYRDFKVYDDSGELLAWASSTWLLMHIEKRKTAPIPQFILDFEMPALEFLPRPDRKIPALEIPRHRKAYQVGWFELDWNEHLNNLHYILKMLDVLPIGIHRRQTLRRLDIIFKLETSYGEPIRSEASSIGETTFLHRIRNGADKDIAIGRTRWTTPCGND